MMITQFFKANRIPSSPENYAKLGFSKDLSKLVDFVYDDIPSIPSESEDEETDGNGDGVFYEPERIKDDLVSQEEAD